MKKILIDKNKYIEMGEKKRNREIYDSWLEIAVACGYNAPSGEAARQMFRRIYKERHGHFPNKYTDKSNSFINKKQKGRNNLEVTAGVNRIMTEEEAVEAFDIDLDEWHVEVFECKGWETARKEIKKIIDVEKGVNKVKDTGKMFVQPLYSVRLKCVRKKSFRQKFPTIQPVTVNITNKYSPKKQKQNKLRHIFIISDTHFGFSIKKRSRLLPFHDRKALDVVRQIINDKQPDELIIMGDLLDFAEFSDKFTVKPEYRETAQPALEEAGFFLGTLRNENPHMKIAILEGNHDERLTRSVFNNNIAAYQLKKIHQKNNENLISLSYLLGLKDMGIDYIEGYPNNKYEINKYLNLIHGDLVSSGNGDTAKKLVNKSFISTGQGHIHREEMVSKTYHTNNGVHITKGFSVGTMARLDGIVPAKKGEVDWQQGFGEIYVEDGDYGAFQINLVSIQNGKCIYNGRIYNARSEDVILKELNESCPYFEEEGWNLLHLLHNLT